jgi:hypothetical protein
MLGRNLAAADGKALLLTGLSAGEQNNLRQYVQQLGSLFNYQDVGDAPLLGARRTVVVAHGCSREPAIANAIHVAVKALESDSIARVADYLESTPILSELKLYSARWVLDHWKSRWGGPQEAFISMSPCPAVAAPLCFAPSTLLVSIACNPMTRHHGG